MRTTITFYQIFLGDETVSEKPKNEVKNCDFDFGWSKYFSEPSDRESKIQKSTFQSLDSDRSLGPRRASWWVGRLIASSFERFRGFDHWSRLRFLDIWRNILKPWPTLANPGQGSKVMCVSVIVP